jgi:hypothetical protein
MQFINLKYCILQGAAVLVTLLQRRVAQPDENGTIAMTVRDKVNKVSAIISRQVFVFIFVKSSIILSFVSGFIRQIL